MMTKHVLSICMSVLFLTGCNRNETFLGHLTPYTGHSETCSVQADTVSIGPMDSPYFAVYDSILISYTPRANSSSFMIYHVRTGELLGCYFPCGHGHSEYLTVSPVTQFFDDKGQLMSLIYAPNEMKLMKWNITASLETGKTICTDAVTYKWTDDNRGVPFSRCTLLKDDRVLVYRPSVCMPEDYTITQPIWQVRTYTSNELTKDISAYKPIENENSRVAAETFFSAFSSIKPDMTKLAEAMCLLPQINIIDIETGRVDGYIMTGSDDYSIFHTDMANAKTYYNGIQATDKYIFAIWCGKQITNDNYSLGANELHVFNWEGRLIKKVMLSAPAHSISLDVPNNLLYAWHEDSDILYRYSVEDMGL